MAVQVGYLEELVVPARFDRGMVADLFNQGVRKTADLTVANGGGKVSNVAAGVAYIKGNLNADQGTYRLWLDAGVSVTHDAAVTNPRVDQVIAYVRDSDELGSGALNDGVIAIAKGTEASGAQVVSPGAAGYRSGAVLDANLPKNSVRLFDVLVPVGAGAIPAGNYVDRRTFSRGFNARKQASLKNRQSTSYGYVDDTVLGIQFEANGTSMFEVVYLSETSLSIAGGEADFQIYDTLAAAAADGRQWRDYIGDTDQPHPVALRLQYVPTAGLHRLSPQFKTTNAGFVNANFSDFYVKEIAQPVTG